MLSAVPVARPATPLTRRWDGITVKHKWNAVPKNSESLGHPSADTTINLYLALKPQRENALIDALLHVTDPRHAKYGAHLSKEQVAQLVAPYPDTLNLVNSWLEERDIPPSSVSIHERISQRQGRREPGVEGNLDIQSAEAMTYPIPDIYYSAGGEEITPGDIFTGSPICLNSRESHRQSARHTAVTSTKFRRNLKRACANWSHGLACAASASSSRLVTGTSATGGNVGVRFVTQFPASFTTTLRSMATVGGTTSDNPEVAASLSGGGFSNHFPRPPYQVNVVPPFLQSIGNMYQGLFKFALGVVLVLKGQHEEIGGTSGSTPIVAGIVSLLNDYRISKGKPPLGFLNPWLYGDGLAGLNDTTSGSDPGCGTYGFPAIIGWDAALQVTGLGTPDFVKLEEMIDKQK
ncbi:peptidase S8/S53 domain-containing protein [Lactarius psammicola]|nr:peptidase S8/S53 domain-containing protein [Lactarius psammicola]